MAVTTPSDLQQNFIDAASACAQAAKIATKAAATTADPTAGGSLAAQAMQFAAAARDLAAGLMELQQGPVKNPAGTPPDVYEAPASSP